MSLSEDDGETCRDRITNYRADAKNEQIRKLVSAFGLDEGKLKKIMHSGVTDQNLNQYGRFDELLNTVDKTKAKRFFEGQEVAAIQQFKVNMKSAELLKDFILTGGFEFDETALYHSVPIQPPYTGTLVAGHTEKSIYVDSAPYLILPNRALTSTQGKTCLSLGLS